MPDNEPADDAALIEFLNQVRSELGGVFDRESGRFPTGSGLLERFDEAVDRLMERGWEYLDQVQEAHNELCTAVLILEDEAEPRCATLHYEPAIESCEKRFDFRADFRDRPSIWLEVKTVHPKPLDRWPEYERDVQEGRFPENARLILDRSWLGGELYHRYFAARSRILHHTVEVEKKVAECFPGDEPTTILVLFSNGFDWGIDTLEDFLHFYRYGRHFQGDHFRLMEQHYIEEQSVELRRTITHVAFIKRPVGAVRPVGGRWSVEPIRFSPERGFW